jgi:SNF2 family DNA or RNA helicase
MADPKILVIQPQAAAHGVTLTAANTVVWWGPTSSLETYAQANARVHRSGQKHPCTVVQLQGSGVEKRVYSLLDKRIDVHTKMIDLYKELLD